MKTLILTCAAVISVAAFAGQASALTISGGNPVAGTNYNYLKYNKSLGSHIWRSFHRNNTYHAAVDIKELTSADEQRDYALGLGDKDAVDSALSLSINKDNLDRFTEKETNFGLSHISEFRDYQEKENKPDHSGIGAPLPPSGIELKSITDEFHEKSNDLNIGTRFGKDNNDGVASAPVPEPSTFVLLGAGLLGASLIRRRAKK